MKNLILLACLFISVGIVAQDKIVEKNLEEIQVSPPQFTGVKNVLAMLNQSDTEAISTYLAKNIEYPEDSYSKFIEGVEVVQFVVTPEGNVTDFEVINSVSPTIDEEVIRVLKSTNGMWKPGLNNDAPTAMSKEVSMVFSVDDADFDVAIKQFLAKAKYHYSIASKKLFYKQNVKKALKHYDMGIQYLPNDECLLRLRGLCKYELGDEEGANKDWNRINRLAENKSENENSPFYLSQNIVNLKGYEAMNSVLNK